MAFMEQGRWQERSRLVRWRRLWRTRRPVTFNEKVRYKMLRDRRPLIVTFADKVDVRDYVARVVGERYLPKAYHVNDDPNTLRDVDLPERYVVKPNHGSAVVLLVSPDAPPANRLPPPSEGWVACHVRPDVVDRDALVALGASWLERLHGYGPNHEWAYSQIRRRILVEEFLDNGNGSVPDDYKFFVFNGRCRYIQLDGARHGAHTQDFYDVDWNHLEMSGGPPWADPPVPPPTGLDEMIDVVERLGQETDFVRVDLYNLAGRIVFGELTNYPAAGDSPFFPESFNTDFGGQWVLPTRYKKSGRQSPRR